MPPTGKPTKRAPWILMGPEPVVATCSRCSATLPKPLLPIGVDQFIDLVGAFIDQHWTCAPKGVSSAANS